MISNGSNIKFPVDFGWGVATAAYQIEGGHNEDGRGPSIWDTFSQAGKCEHGATGNVACDHYHRIEEDIQILKQLGVGYYRMSISWSRIFPTGKPPLNQPGIDYYNKEISLLLAAGIQPMITLYHWDLPQKLEDEGGWLSEATIFYFVKFASTCFEHFGSKVKYWVTFNEPYVITLFGYQKGLFPPARSSNRSLCSEGNSETEPYIVGHNLLLAHAKVVQLYRREYSNQDGKIGMALNSDWFEPLTGSQEDQEAAQRIMEFSLSWFADPIFKGDYPKCMRERVKSRLPVFTEEEQILLKGSADFFGLNSYTGSYAEPLLLNKESNAPITFELDSGVKCSQYREGKPIGTPTAAPWLFMAPWCLRKLLHWIKERYSNPDIWILENGAPESNESQKPIEEVLKDEFRCNFYRDHLKEVSQAIYEDHVNVKGYCAWTMMDNFEWLSGYSQRFGLYYVDFEDNLKRYAKDSATVYAEIIKHNK